MQTCSFGDLSASSGKAIRYLLFSLVDLSCVIEFDTKLGRKSSIKVARAILRPRRESMKNVAVTGASGYLGQQLISRLERDDSVERIIGISRRAPKVASSKLKFYSHDICEPFDKIFAENNIDTAVHLAFVIRAARDIKAARATDIGGSKNFLDACKSASVKKVSFLSSFTAYGAYPDNPQPMGEDTPLRPNAGFQYPYHKAEADKMFQEFMKQNPPTENDFIFVDPPYDTEFSTYAKNTFGKEDHTRLANYLIDCCKGKWMLVIKTTEFIYNLYNKKGISIHSFDKNYQVSFKNRNERNVEHLIITNY